MDDRVSPPAAPRANGADLTAFYQLTLLASGLDTVDPLLDALAAHLGVPALTITAPLKEAAGADRRPGAVIVPLVYRDWHLGDLCAPGATNADPAAVAARLEFFGPLVAQHLVLCTRLDEEGPGPLSRAAAAHNSAARDMHDERDRLEAVLDATNDAILLVDTRDTLAMATPQFETFTGISRYDIIGMPVERLAQRTEGQPGLPAAITNVISALAGNFSESLGGEFELAQPLRRVLVWYSLPVYIRRGILLGRIFAFRDATRERELDRMKTDFVSLVSHELRTPLTSVKGFSDLLLENSADRLDAESREYLGIIAFNADRLMALINDILDITRIDTDRIELRPEACQIADAVAQAAQVLASALDQRGHTLTLDLPPDLPPVWADQTRLVQIVTNLLGNAAKYTLEPGDILIRAFVADAADQLPAAAPRGQILPCLVVSIRDTGIGIAPGDNERLFQRFYRAESDAGRGIGGTGLGLAIVKSLVELQGGRVWYESVPQRGSIFSFSIPIARGAHLGAS